MTDTPRPALRLLGALIAACLITVQGCGEKAKSAKLIPVTGKVTVGDTPLTSGMVNFVADESKGNKTKMGATGQIGSDGSYKLVTDNKDGAAEGWYKVSITIGMAAAPPGNPSDSPKVTPLPVLQINQKYQNAESSGISIEVKESAPADSYNIKLAK